jgi:DNA-binding winged helix-turn-helix (wHTH) protein
VRKLRQALGDEAETPQYIETLRKASYNFCNTRSFAPDGQILLNCVDKQANVFALDVK